MRWVTTLVGDELGRVPFERQHRLDELDDITPTPFRNLSQHRLEAVLRDHVAHLVGRRRSGSGPSSGHRRGDQHGARRTHRRGRGR